MNLKEFLIVRYPEILIEYENMEEEFNVPN